MSSVFINPNTGHRITLSYAGFWSLLFGPLYFAYKGAWGAAAISLCLALVTAGISILIIPFFAHAWIEDTLQSKGYKAAGKLAAAVDTSAQDPIDALVKLTELKSSGSITDDEFATLKKKLIA